MRQTRPCEVRVTGGVRGAELRQAILREGLRRGIRDAPLGHASDIGCRGLVGREVGPPCDDRGVGKEQPRDETLLAGGRRSVRAQHDDLARSGVAADADLRIELRVALDVRDEHDDTHGVLTRRVVGGLDRLLLQTVRRHDDVGEDAAQGHGAALFAHAHEGAGDLRDGGVGQIDDHGRLQTRPSRARSSSADGGPQEPGEYCSSGPPCWLQYSSTGSRIFQESSTSS